MTSLADLELHASLLRVPADRLPGGSCFVAKNAADTIAAYVAAQRERDALIRDLTTIVRMPNAEHEADKHNRAVELLRLSALPKEPKP